MRQVININENGRLQKIQMKFRKKCQKGGAGYICPIHGII